MQTVKQDMKMIKKNKMDTNGWVNYKYTTITNQIDGTFKTRI